MDAIALLTSQHREADTVFDEYQSLGPDAAERKKEIARKVITDLSVHAGIEEVAFYPTVREALPDMEDEIEDDLEEHQRAKQVLADMQGMDPADPQLDAKFRQLIEDVRHHVADEEDELFPRVRQALTAEELDELGAHMQDLMGKVPNRPASPRPAGAAGQQGRRPGRRRDRPTP